jgi:heme exporter protein C
MESMSAVVFLWVLLSIFAAYLWSPTAAQFIGQSSRIVFFHVPMAWIASLAFLLSGWHSFRFLRTRDLAHDRKAKVAVRQGLLFALLATVTGSIFAKIMWGSFWNWDPREISITMLLFIYAAYLVLRGAVDDPIRRAHLAAVYALFAFVTMPFFVFIIPRVYFSLHPDTLINVRGKIEMEGRILVTFLGSLAGFTAFYVLLYRLECRLEELLYAKGETV